LESLTDSYISSPKFTLGCALGCVFTGLIIVSSLLLHFLLEKENKRRDREFGKPSEHEFLDVSDLGDNHPKFRYLT